MKAWAQACADCGIVCTLNYSLIKVLGEPVTIQQWNIDGLPADDFSVESAIIIMWVNYMKIVLKNKVGEFGAKQHVLGERNSFNFKK